MDSKKPGRLNPVTRFPMLRTTAIVCTPALLALAALAAVDVGATRVDEHSRSQLGSRYESPGYDYEDAEAYEESSDIYADEEAFAETDETAGQERGTGETPLPLPEGLTGDPVDPAAQAALPAWPLEAPYPSPVFYAGRGEAGEDPHYAFINSQFNPLGYGSLSYLSETAFASGLLETRWRMLDPAFSNRIWLRSLYPYPRVEEASDEVAGVLAATRLNSRYKHIGHTFELMARAAVAGNHDDAQAFLAGYRKCITERRCEGHDFYERAVADIHDVYAVPAALLLEKGHCVRARYLNDISLRMLRAVDPPRFAARASVNRIYMLSAIAEQEQCPGQRATVAQAIDRELFGDETPPTEPDSGVSPLFRASTWKGHLPNLYLYNRASAQFRLHDFTGALRSLDAIGDRSGQTLHDMAGLMRVRALSELSKARPDTVATARMRMQSILADMRPTSLRTDASEYLADLEADLEADLARARLAANLPAPAPGDAP
jgi:hypothetical protein